MPYKFNPFSGNFDEVKDITGKADRNLSNLTTTSVNVNLTMGGSGTPQHYGLAWGFGIAGAYSLTITESGGSVRTFNYTSVTADDPYTEDLHFMSAFNTNPAMMAAGYRVYNSDSDTGEPFNLAGSNHMVLVGPNAITFTVTKTGNAALIDFSGTYYQAATATPTLTVTNLRAPTANTEAATKGYTDSLVAAERITSAANQSLSEGAVIALTSSFRQKVRIKGATNFTTNCTLPNGTIHNQELFIQGTEDARVVVIANGGNVFSNGNIEYYNGTLRHFIWDNTDLKWYQVGA